MKETLKKLRIDNRYSQELLAKTLGVSRLSYMKYESGEVEPSIEIIRKLSKIYNVSYKTLIDNELNTSHNPITYNIEHKDYFAASPEPAYGMSINKNTENISPNVILDFARILSELQNTISNLQNQINSQLNVMQTDTKENCTFRKSKSFNKEEYFSRIGKVNIDSTYIDELRGASLI